MGVAPTGDHGSNEQGRVIPVEKPLLRHHLRPFQLQILYSIGSIKRPGVNLLVIGYSGGQRVDDIRCANSFLEVEMAPLACLIIMYLCKELKLQSPWAASTVFFISVKLLRALT
jgi:hypothetical protein